MQVSRVDVDMLGVAGDSMRLRSAALAANGYRHLGVRFLSEGMKVRRMQAVIPDAP